MAINVGEITPPTTNGEFTYICPGCPKLRALKEQQRRVTGMPECEATKDEYVNHIQDQLVLLDKAAAKIGCLQLEDKELPGPDVDVPPLSQEWGDFSRQCLAHAQYIKLRQEVGVV